MSRTDMTTIFTTHNGTAVRVPDGYEWLYELPSEPRPEPDDIDAPTDWSEYDVDCDCAACVTIRLRRENGGGE